MPANTSDLKASYLLTGLALDALFLTVLWKLAVAMKLYSVVFIFGVLSLQSPCGQYRTNIRNYDIDFNVNSVCVPVCVVSVCAM